MFRAEDPVNFTYRVLDAVKRRLQTEKLIKFHCYCDCMPIKGLGELDANSMKRIEKSATRNKLVRDQEDTLQNV